MPAAESPPEDLQTPTLAQLLASAMNWRLEDVHTCQWGYVTSYDATSQKAGVQLIRRRPFTNEGGDRQTERPAPLVGVPVIFPGSGPYSITWPLASGDFVLVVFAEHSTSEILAGGQQDVDPDDDRMHSLSDPVAIPGLRAGSAIAGPPPDDALCITVPIGKTIRLGSKDASTKAGANDDLRILVQLLKTFLGIPDAAFAALAFAAAGTLGITTYAYIPLSSDTTPPYPAGGTKVEIE